MRRADVLCVAPASANTMAKLAHGLADNLLTSAALACTAPLVLAPAMNNHMYEHAATQANLEPAARPRRDDRGARHRPAGLARRVGGGPARRAGPDPRGDRGAARAGAVAPRSMDGLRVLVTAGGTREPIDSVRYVGNRSSGRMGLALAAEAPGAGPTSRWWPRTSALRAPAGVRLVEVETAAELLEAAAAPSSPAPTCC